MAVSEGMRSSDALLIVASACTAACAHAQAPAPFPAKPIKFVVPFPAGGPVDLTARTLGPKVEHRFRSDDLVDNRPGAATIIGTEIAATPRDVVKRMQSEVQRAIALPDAKQILSAEGAEMIGSTPEELAAYLKTEIAKWAKVVQLAGVTAE
jgi:tripartite-type tricarboxylate transporter receptor subunit TctC